MTDNPLISVVIPVFNEEESLERLYSELSQVLEPIANWEIIFVDDGSDDNSNKIIMDLAESEICITVIQFFKNHKHFENAPAQNQML